MEKKLWVKVAEYRWNSRYDAVETWLLDKEESEKFFGTREELINYLKNTRYGILGFHTGDNYVQLIHENQEGEGWQVVDGKKKWKIKKVGFYDALNSWRELEICNGDEFYGSKEELITHLKNRMNEDWITECEEEECVEAGPWHWIEYWYPASE